MFTNPWIQNHTHTHTHSFVPVFIHLFIRTHRRSCIHLLIYFFIGSLTHSSIHRFIHSFPHALLALPTTHSLSRSLTTSARSSPRPSTASFQEAEPPSRLGPLVLTPRTFSSIATSSLLNRAGVCPGVQRRCFPLRNRCSYNDCFDFPPVMPENSTHSSSMQEGIPPLGMARACSAWGCRF